MKKKLVIITLLFSTIALSWTAVHYRKRCVRWVEKRAALHRVMAALPKTGVQPGQGTLPQELQNLPYADSIVDAIDLPIRGLPEAYNAAMTADGAFYWMLFRYDTAATPHLGVVRLDPRMQQTAEEYREITGLSRDAMDVRILPHKNDYYIFYNDAGPQSNKYRRMGMARLDLIRFHALDPLRFPFHLQSTEKNWAPFVYEEQLLLEYALDPHQILTPQAAGLEEAPFLCESATHSDWSAIWGLPRGGTPPLLIGEHYLGFFHSSFMVDRFYRWYVMGAYLFEAHPPFRIVAKSPYPLLFEGIYDAPQKEGRPDLHAIFPCGLVLVEEEGQQMLYVSCGVNDTAIKIVKFDLKRLLKSLN